MHQSVVQLGISQGQQAGASPFDGWHSPRTDRLVSVRNTVIDTLGDCFWCSTLLLSLSDTHGEQFGDLERIPGSVPLQRTRRGLDRFPQDIQYTGEVHR